MSTKVIVLQVESFIVYYFAPIPQASIVSPKSLYWADNLNLTGSGPFNTLFDAGKDYEKVMKQRRNTQLAVIPKEPGNLIQVNFKTKSRIIT